MSPQTFAAISLFVALVLFLYLMLASLRLLPELGL